MDKEYYYGVTRTNDYLAHYGVRGMKWGVRKAIQSGNTKALGRQYKKAQKKLAKLEKRANNGAKYAKRAAALGAGAAAAGGLAALGTTGVGTALTRAGNAAASAGRGVGGALVSLGGSRALRKGKIGSAMRTAGYNLQNASPKASQVGYGASRAIRAWGGSNSIGSGVGKAIDSVGKAKGAVASRGMMATKLNPNSAQARLGRISNNQIARAGAAAAAAGLAGAAGYNAYRAATTKRAARKAAEFRKEMNQAFAGTRYGAPRRKRRR